MRRAYPYKQRIAPVIEGKLPAHDEFEEVNCRDISAGGFSYFTPLKPDFKEIVVALGFPPSLTYLSADVMHGRPTEYDGQDESHAVSGCSIRKTSWHFRDWA